MRRVFRNSEEITEKYTQEKGLWGKRYSKALLHQLALEGGWVVIR